MSRTARGRYARGDRIRPINHKGTYYQVTGPLNLPRCPQGRPVPVQAGSSDTGRRFAARHAEAVFTAHLEKATAQAFYANLKSLVAAEGRAPGEVLILPGLSPMIGATQAQAQRLAREVKDLSDHEVGRKRLSARFGGHDFSHLPLDRPLAPEDFPPPASVEAARSRTEVILSLVRAREADAAGAARKPRRRPRPFHRRRHARTDRRSDRGLVCQRCRRRLQYHAAAAAGDARRLFRGGNSAAAKAWPVPHELRRQDAARALWPAAAGERLRSEMG